MPFKPGESGNKNGRPTGAQNKVRANVKQAFIAYQEEYYSTGNMFDDLAKVKPVERLNFYIQTLAYTTPKLTSTTITNDFDKLTDNEINGKLLELIEDGQESEN